VVVVCPIGSRKRDCLQESHAATGRKDDGAPRHLPRQVHHREGFPSAGQAIQEQAALQGTAAGAQLVGVLGKHDRLALDPFEQPVGQHNVVSVDLR
jgi:hypothetical protein